MAAIPPYSSTPAQTPGLGGADVSRQARTAAQRAFFQAALGRAEAPATAAATGRDPQPKATANSSAAVVHGTVREPAPGERMPRPGSIINIVV